MKTNRKAFKRGILSLVALETLSLVIILTMNAEMPRNDVFPRLSDLLNNLRMPLFILFVIPLNFPGLALARQLGLFAAGGWNPPDPHPVAGWIVGYVFSMLFWAACIWVVVSLGGKESSRK